MIKNILVTGSNRSGTTWLGKMLSLSDRFWEIYEPFNSFINQSNFFNNIPFQDHYHYVLFEESYKVKQYINRKIFYSIITNSCNNVNFKEVNQFNKFIILQKNYQNIIDFLLQNKRILIKDPIALLSADWLAKEYSAQVVVMIRHPLSYVASIKRLNWNMCLTSFTEQSEFMNTLPENLARQIRQQVSKNTEDYDGYRLEDAALSWKVFHYVIANYQQKYSDWLFIRHEDLCINFMDGLENIYNKLSLVFTEKVKDSIQLYCNTSNQIDLGKITHVLQRNSNKIPEQWRKILTLDEVTKIREITADIADLFYDQSYWL